MEARIPPFELNHAATLLWSIDVKWPLHRAIHNSLPASAALIVLAVAVHSVLAGSRIVAVTDQPAPSSDQTFQGFSSPVISSSGDVAFQAFLSGPTTEFAPHGVFAGTVNDLQLVAAAGQMLPGDDAVRFRTPGPPQLLTADRRTLFYGQLINEGTVNSENDYGIWTGSPQAVQTMARRGDPAPGLPAGTSFSLFFANPTSFGKVGLSASLQGPGVDAFNDSAAWIGSLANPSHLQLIVRAGEQAPGLGEDVSFRSLGTPSVNTQSNLVLGGIAFDASTDAFISGIWAGTPVDLRLLTSSQTAAPGVLDRNFESFGEPRINHRGDVAFTGYLSVETPEQQRDDTGIWIGNVASGSLQAIAFEGGAANEFAPNALFRGSTPGVDPYYPAFSTSVLGGSGRVAFSATVEGDGIDFDHNDAVWVSDPTQDPAVRARAVIAREGDQPPGTPDGTRFVGQDFGDDLLPAFERPLVASTGQIAFEASTSGPWDEHGRGIWFTDLSGRLRLVAHTGTQLEVTPGDFRTISLLSLLAGGTSDDGYAAALNDASQIAYGASFTDGTAAVIVTTLVVGDTNADEIVSVEDLNNVRNNFGGAGLGDTNDDGIIDIIDLNNVRNSFGLGQADTVPEPAGVMLALVGLIGVIRHRNRRRS